MTAWHQKTVAEVLEELSVGAAPGLDEAEAERRRGEHGRNELTGGEERSRWRLLWEQLTELMVVILIIAAAISALLGDLKDAISIGAIVVLNALLGFTQEYRAEQAMAALRKLSVPSVRVRRGGRVREIPAPELVPGDVMLLEAGNLVAADGRLIEAADLQTQEAALTGESAAVRKSLDAIADAEAALGDRHNMVFGGTAIVAGRGVAVVTETGMKSQLGHVARMIAGVEREPTPLQRRLAQLGKGLAAAALLLVAVIFALGWMRGEDHTVLFLTAVSIAVAAVPEGLPAVVTIALTLGARRMLDRRVLIRKLPAVETLGSVTVICSDKTGTLTENRMTATALTTADERIDLSGEVERPERAAFLLAAAALCNDAWLGEEGPVGDPTETALLEAAARFGAGQAALVERYPRVGELPFDSVRKRMSTVHRMDAGDGPVPGQGRAAVLAAKGAFDGMLEIAVSVWTGDAALPLDGPRRERLQALHAGLAESGLRVLAVGFRWLDELPEKADPAMEGELTLLGLIGLVDPPRADAAAAVAKCQQAGIRVVMITGDHPLTARHIAADLGIAGDAEVLTGREIEPMTAEELAARVENVRVHARVSPAHKLRIIEALQQRGEIVSMTGDGVNDAPALKKADIGVAMGITGTDVAKQAADMVLLDDNFATIVDAVEEGRVIYDNVRKFIRYILGTNSGEIWLMLGAPLIGMPLPLLPLQILWMNLVTDGLPALALGVEPAEADAMKRPPHRPDESIFGRGLGVHVLWVGLLMGALALGPGWWLWKQGEPHWRTIVFTTMTFAQMAHVMAIRSERRPLWEIGVWSNRPLAAAVALTILLQIALIYLPFLNALFGTQPLTAAELGLTAGLGAVVFVAVEGEKALRRGRD